MCLKNKKQMQNLNEKLAMSREILMNWKRRKLHINKFLPGFNIFTMVV